MQLEEVKKLAHMARIDIEESELAEIANDFDAILAYVGQIKEISSLSSETKFTQGESSDASKEAFRIKLSSHDLVNVMREDEFTNGGGEYTEKIVEQFPDSQNGYLKVKQIL